ncbi:tol-pal system protein YbgF [Pseudorhodoferax sp.]|uniref:tol-pal system protein YbgF n=1 Tax=Pseudorhodoferax sp. TaxID=1993553 RepID=UPI002DD65C50|nr:tol-pal system protein YbgF [Pseudorhodoferax sp.]
MKHRLGAMVLAAAALVPAAAQASLFDDNEARKAILELRGRVAQNEEQAKARIDELVASNQRLNEQLAAVQRSLLDLNGQLEQMRIEMARLRGGDEQLQRDVADLQKRQKDLGQGIDERMRRLEPVKVTLDGRDFMAEPDERRTYDDAVALMRSGEFDKAALALAAFQRRYPSSGYGDSVRYWLGNAQYARRDYKEAINTFRTFVSAAPEHPRAPEALLALANSQAEMKDTKAARKTVEDLLKAYPKSEAAQAGRERLASLK